jgi:hypothetical protein
MFVDQRQVSICVIDRLFSKCDLRQSGHIMLTIYCLYIFRIINNILKTYRQCRNKCFCLFMCKFQNFVITQHYCINAIYVNCWKIYNLLVHNVLASKHNEKLARDSLFVLFLKLVQINFIFTDIVCMFSIYCLLFGKYTNNFKLMILHVATLLWKIVPELVPNLFTLL